MPVHVPRSTVRVEPSRAEPDSAGAVVLTGAVAVTTAVVAVVAVVVPPSLDAVTTARVVLPTSALVSV